MIPRIIHQTSREAAIPEQWLAFQSRARALHPDWEYHHWTDADNLQLIREAVPQWRSLYESLPRGIMKADMIRYVYLLVYGGVYLDFDYEMLRAFDILDQSLVLPLSRGSSSDGGPDLGNCIMASEPGHPFWTAVLEELRRGMGKLKREPLEDEVIVLTGPGLLSRVYRGLKDTGGICMPSRDAFHPPLPSNEREYAELVASETCYGIHHCDGTWTAKTISERIRRRIAYLKAGRRGRSFR